MMMCYGIPILIVAVSSAAFSGDYNVDNLCWLSQETGMIWTFVAPVTVIVLINTGIMYVVVNTIYKRSGQMVGKSVKEKNTFKQLRKAARGAVMLLPLMGTTWLIGPFAIGSAGIPVDYLFNFLNGCQGIFIFIIYCVLENEIRDCFKKRFKRKNYVHSMTEMTARSTTESKF
ncbi:adhesion G-protein coupled receptor D1-like [Antedon mediterranea]|uniref:adhesion G-protein coupled receptor D1-like n=1 Tax=Antedon mediterranea TaxID=105859 RepID=UPI003AF9AE43